MKKWRELVLESGDFPGLIRKGIFWNLEGSVRMQRCREAGKSEESAGFLEPVMKIREVTFCV